MPSELANLMLDSLPAELRESLISRMQHVDLPVETVLYKPGETPRHVHFMTSGVASVVTFMADGRGAEVGFIGREGVVEGINLLGPAKASTTAFIQSEGTALRIKFADFQSELFASEPLLKRVLESVQSQGFILSQLAACNGLHEIEERLARWLLMARDRVKSDKFFLTQEFLAEMLGARRTSVTLAAGSLQRSELIKYRRGNIHILDAAGLESKACECYTVVRDLVVGLYQQQV